MGGPFGQLKVKTESKVPFPPAPPTAQKAKLYFIAFPTSYLVESGFSSVPYLLSKVRNCLDAVKTDDLSLSLTHCERTYKNVQCSSGPRNTLNIITIVNRISLVV
jgi:hypothetical protein